MCKISMWGVVIEARVADFVHQNLNLARLLIPPRSLAEVSEIISLMPAHRPRDALR
jgi:hypothetical protein